MTKSGYILSLDQGTTSCRAILFDREGAIIHTAQQEFRQIFPEPGWVEHDADEIWQVQLQVMKQVAAQVPAGSIAAIGITNQRETTVVWDRVTGKPLHNAIVWQCRRTSALCHTLKEQGLEPMIKQKTGLVLDPYFSGTKLKWLLDTFPHIREKADKGEALFGTIDSWLIWNLTEGKVHATDVSNASRTMLLNIHTLQWDEDILVKFGIPAAMLPEVRPSSGLYGHTALLDPQIPVPIAGAAGDQQAALFGQGCFREGMAKNTYGTGCFILNNTGDKPVLSKNGLLTTVAWQIGDRVDYALEGSVFIAGAVIQWLRDGLGLIGDAAETEALARSVDDTEGVYFVPAFAGLGTPYWEPDARGMITGLTRASGKAHLVRAALEAIAYQSRDVLEVMQQETGVRLSELRVDGGAVRNEFLMQFQADMMSVSVVRPKVTESTALGAAFLAGLAVGFWSGLSELEQLKGLDRVFQPEQGEAYSEAKYAGWRRALSYQLSRREI
ncbi:Glycerol kinase [Paenibacillus solanacearum]|uniref:Glycerol kinase n=1 Tax=Paenibacillus solanacearum TaxID=2048548 RepID=A0A916K2F3_9BACL|nr:glycerol kinase GlpK [Paenibacillus solanacearum]CAG7630658.1 Glycerol kinase [Paenibacillus solanacearum]